MPFVTGGAVLTGADFDVRAMVLLGRRDSRVEDVTEQR